MSELRIAMWSGPRNISTALLRSWGNRPDTFVTDEPLYAHYLLTTGAPHPGADEVIRSQENDWRKVAEWLTGAIPHGNPIWYQKHMAHHLLPHMEREWLEGLTHCFLIRDPEEMLTSLLQVLAEPSVEDTGLPQQVELYRWVAERGGKQPPVIDSRDVLENPRGILQKLCAELEIPFLEAMLSWPLGPRETDGVWAKHWYANVERSTGFQRYAPKDERVPEQFASVLEQCRALYQELHARRLTAGWN